MAAILDLASWALILVGGGFCLLGGIGLLRMPDFYSRLHAGGLTDTMGAGCIILGLILQAGLTLVAVKLVFLALFSLIASPAAVHALAKAAYKTGKKPLLHREEDGA